MKTYHIFTARLHYHEFNKFKAELKAYNLDQVKETIKAPVKLDDNLENNTGGLGLNPFYTVIIDVTDGGKIIEYNKHLSFCEDKRTKDK